MEFKNIVSSAFKSDISKGITEIKYCPECGGPITKKIKLFDNEVYVPVMCECQKRQRAVNERQREVEEKQNRLKSLFNNSLMDGQFVNETFDNWDFKKSDKYFYDLGMKYCRKFKEIKENNIGLLILGQPGNGKTYLSNAIANNLLEKGVPVICVGINNLLERIKKTYGSYGQEGEDSVIRALSNAELLIIDDLGTEKASEWSASIVYRIIDNRDRNNLPLIVSTNLTKAELTKRYNERTVNRIIKLCQTIVIKQESIRLDIAKKKKEKMKEILFSD